MHASTRKKKILYISQSYPYVADSGGKIKTLNTLVTLSKEHELSAIFVSDSLPTFHERQYLERKNITVQVLKSLTILSSVKDNLLELLVYYLQGIPQYVFQYRYKPAFARIAKIIKTFKPDVIHVDHLNMAQYLPKEKKEVWVLEHHNVEAYLYWTRFIHTRKFTRKLYLCIEMVLTYFMELRLLFRFDHIFAISGPEQKRMHRMFGVSHVSVQPLVYKALPVRKISHPCPSILFIGTLGWPPNEDAIEWFLADMFPAIRKRIPTAEFHVVGRLGLRYVPGAKDGLVIHGFQKDLTRHLARADVFVLPFRMGGGMRLKALTALSSGIAVVTTPLGIEGLGVRDGAECLIARQSKQFAQDVIRLLQDSMLRDRLGANALEYVRAHHSEVQNKAFLAMYARATAPRNTEGS